MGRGAITLSVEAAGLAKGILTTTLKGITQTLRGRRQGTLAPRKHRDMGGLVGRCNNGDTVPCIKTPGSFSQVTGRFRISCTFRGIEPNRCLLFFGTGRTSTVATTFRGCDTGILGGRRSGTSVLNRLQGFARRVEARTGRGRQAERTIGSKH